MFQIIRDDITKIKAEAIVNTANPAVKVASEVTFFMFARHGRALAGASPEHARIVGSV